MNQHTNQIIQFIESLKIAQGRRAGENFCLLPWQQRFIRGAFKPGIFSAALTVSRQNGKSTLAAAIATAAVMGPLKQPMGNVIIVASSFSQAYLIFSHIKFFMQPWIMENKSRFRIWDSSHHAEIQDRETGAGVRCIGSDAKRMMGLAPSLVMADELASWEANQIDKALAALDTSLGKIPNSRILYIGTRAADPEHPFEALCYGGADFCQVHAAKDTDPPFNRRTWVKANPSLDHLPDTEAKIRKSAERAKKDKRELAMFKALHLNMGISETVERLLLDAGTWESIEVDGIEAKGSYILGLDLGSSVSMSAAAAYFYKSGELDGLGQFPLFPSLAQRGLSAGVGNLYLKMQDAGDLFQAGDLVCDIGSLIKECVKRWGVPEAIVCDRWKIKELQQILTEIEFPETEVIERGMGFFHGGEDVRAFQGACLDGRVKPRKSLILRAAMATARVEIDPAANQKITKKHQRINDDLAIACTLAIGLAERNRSKLLEKDDGPSYMIIKSA